MLRIISNGLAALLILCSPSVALAQGGGASTTGSSQSSAATGCTDPGGCGVADAACCTCGTAGCINTTIQTNLNNIARAGSGLVGATDQRPLEATSGERHDRALLDTPQAVDSCFDLSELDAVSTALDLRVAPPQEVQPAIIAAGGDGA